MSQNKFPIVLLRKGANTDQLDADVSVEYLLNKDSRIRVDLFQSPITGEWGIQIFNVRSSEICSIDIQENSILITGSK